MQDKELRAGLLDLARQLVRLLEGQPPLWVKPSQQKILAALNHEPQSSRRIARIAQRKWNSAFRQQLRELVTAGLARRIAKGYMKP